MIRHNEYLLIEVPEDARNFQIEHNWQLTFDTGQWEQAESGNISNMVANDCVVLGNGTYSILGLYPAITEAQAGEIVDTVMYDLPPSPSNDFQGDWSVGYRDYEEATEEIPNAEYPYFHKAIDSLRSLIVSNNMKPECTLVLKQVK